MDISARLFQRSLNEFAQKRAFVAAPPPGSDPAAAGGAPPGGDPAAAGAPPAPPGGDPAAAGGMPPGGDPMAMGGMPPGGDSAAAGGMPPGGDMLSAIGGGDPAAGGDPSAGAPDPTAPGTPDVKGTPDDSVTRGQADVVMDIVERAMASIGEGRTKEQAQAEFDLEQEGKKKEQENKAKKSDADASATANGAITGQPQGGGGPMGSLGGQLDPSAIGGNTVKMAKEILSRLGLTKSAASAPKKTLSFPPVAKGTKSGIVSVNNQPVEDPSASATTDAIEAPPKSSTAPVLAQR